MFVIDDDPTPLKPRLSETPSFVEETLLSNLINSDVSFVNCTYASQAHQSISSFICLSDNESDGGLKKKNEDVVGLESDGISEWEPSPLLFKAHIFFQSPMMVAHVNRDSTFSERVWDDASMQAATSCNDILKGRFDTGNIQFQLDENVDPKKVARPNNVNANRNTGYVIDKKKQTKEEKMKLMEEKKLKKEACGKSVAELFQLYGEGYFREKEALRTLSLTQRLVVSTGGGAVVRPINWKCMQKGITVYIDVPLEALAQRISAVGTASYPLLHNESDIAAKMGHKDVSDLTPAMIAIETLEQIEDYRKKQKGRTLSPWPSSFQFLHTQYCEFPSYVPFL